MMAPAQLAAYALAEELSAEIQRTFGTEQAPLAETVGAVARLTIECIANSDALYHNWEHTLLVTQVGLEILRGRTLFEPVTPGDWAHLLVACLVHDIGYVRGILAGDDAARGYVIDAAGTRFALGRGASDAALTPYHVERSKLFVAARLGTSDILDANRIARAIEYTRFPPGTEATAAAPGDEAMLVRAVDLIGQMGDPFYLKKTKALFHEFEEAGLNARLGYTSPADLVEHYPEFFWSEVSSHLTAAMGIPRDHDRRPAMDRQPSGERVPRRKIEDRGDCEPRRELTATAVNFDDVVAVAIRTFAALMVGARRRSWASWRVPLRTSE